MVAKTKNARQKPASKPAPGQVGLYEFHDEPTCLEHVLNDINEELYTTKHELSFGATSLLRFLATVAWTSKTNHPERYAKVNPKYARTKPGSTA